MGQLPKTDGLGLHLRDFLLMKTIQRQATVPYSPQQMFDLVNDVAAYPEFVPYCTRTQVFSTSSEMMEAQLCFTKGILSQRFTTRNLLTPGAVIEMGLVEGPFQFLKGRWEFSDCEGGCAVSFNLDFAMQNPFLNLSLGAFFQQIAIQLVDCFSKRADEVYGA